MLIVPFIPVDMIQRLLYILHLMLHHFIVVEQICTKLSPEFVSEFFPQDWPVFRGEVGVALVLEVLDVLG
jgi:hypothetical protein